VREFSNRLLPDQRVIVTTDRQSAFDVMLGHIPFKGAVLNLLAAWWFEKTKHLVPNHLISVPHPNVMVAYNCQPIPIEMVVRGYLTGVTVTSPWYNYQKGELQNNKDFGRPDKEVYIQADKTQKIQKHQNCLLLLWQMPIE